LRCFFGYEILPPFFECAQYKEPKRTFEDSGFVDPAESYYVQFENIVNTKNQNMKTMVDKSRYF
jgi:hypothetical protein